MNTEKNRDRLFRVSCIALTVTSMTFAIRAGMLAPLGLEFGLSSTELGYIASMAFFGFPVATVLGGMFCDAIGLRNLLRLALVCHVIGILWTIGASGFWSLFLSTFLIGFANGMVEAACNPMVATLYPRERTARLNRFHVWFPGGIVIGGLISFAMSQLGFGWQWQMAIILFPTAFYGWLMTGLEFPLTERVVLGHSTATMVRACLSPLFLFLVLCMLFTATTELGTNQWIDVLLQDAGVPGILVLVMISSIMALGRFNAALIVHRFGAVGTLWISSLLSMVGLLALSYFSGIGALLAAVVFALGVTYFWPTMLGVASEHIPESGALGLSLLGGAGMLAVTVFQPLLGYWYDASLAMTGSDVIAGSETLRRVAILPALLIGLFGVLTLILRSKTSSEARFP